MTIGELINALEGYDEDMEVCIGMYQRYGSNFTYDICDELEVNGINKFYGEDIDEAVMLIMGTQMGSIKYEEEEEDEYYE